MEKKKYEMEYFTYENLDQLNSMDKHLIELAIGSAKKAYAPYSKFRVGAAVLLENQEIFTGNNQENASYPVGICAERTLLSYVHANYPNLKKNKLVIVALDSDLDISPCGICRQSILEYEIIQNQCIEILLCNRKGAVVVLPSASSLLPLHFDQKSLF